MNSCILMAEIIKDPELRYTSDGQMPIAEMLIQFPGLRAEDPVETLKVIGWGNLAQQIQQEYHQGDRVVLEGRLSMNTIERPEGFKEKRAEFTATRVHPLTTGTEFTGASTPKPSDSTEPPAAPAPEKPAAKAAKPKQQSPAESPEFSPNYDDIPF